MTNETALNTDGPTTEQFDAYLMMFRHFNLELFGNTLPEPLLNLSRGPQRAIAFFAAKRWKADAQGGPRIVHEISLNPRHLGEGSSRETASTLVHEMCHLWQQTHGTPPRTGYHDREWSKKMVEVGLQPIDAKTGKPSMSAHSMDHREIAGGAFERAFYKLPPRALLPWTCTEARSSKRWPELTPPSGPAGEAGSAGGEPAAKPPKNKLKYSCPSCGANVWGKPQLKIACCDEHEPAVMVAKN